MGTSKPAAEAAAPDEPVPESPPATYRAQYIGEQPRTYRFPGGSISVQRGDVCELPHVPADGMWLVTSLEVTRLPDNHRDNQPSREPADPALIAHSTAEHLELLQRLGVKTSQEAAQ